MGSSRLTKRLSRNVTQFEIRWRGETLRSLRLFETRGKYKLDPLRKEKFTKNKFQKGIIKGLWQPSKD